MSSYKSIAKSSGLIAFVQIAQMLFALIRNKLISVLLGSAAFGLYSIYNTFIEMGTTFSILGLNNSAVREISRCNSDQIIIGKVIYILNRLILIFSLIIFTVTLLFSEKIAFYLFNEDGHQKGVITIAFIMILSVISKEGYAILNGIRSLRDLAISQIASSAIGSIGMILAIYFWGIDSIPASMGIVYLSMSVITYAYVRKNNIHEVKATKIEFKNKSKSLLNIGIGVTIAGAISTIMTIMSKSFLTENYDMSTVGIYQASWTISNLYTGIILTAMGVDFMPRISGIIDKTQEAVKMINEQIIFGIVMASIAITGILLFSKELLYLLYSSEFTEASIIMRWQVLGVFLRVIAFPFSYTIIAKGWAKSYAIIQIIFWVGDYLLLILFSKIWGFNGLGINYFIAYTCYLFLGYYLTKKICNFTISKNLIKVFFTTIFFIITAWFITLIEIKIDTLKYILYITLLTMHFIYIYIYTKKKMGINVIQYIKNKLNK